MRGRKEEKTKEEETKGKKRKITHDITTQWWLPSCGFPEAPREQSILLYLNIYLFLIYLPYVCRVQKRASDAPGWSSG